MIGALRPPPGPLLRRDHRHQHLRAAPDCAQGVHAAADLSSHQQRPWRRRRRRSARAVVAAAAGWGPDGDGHGGGGATTATVTATATATTTTTPTSFSRTRTLSRQQQLHPSLLRPLSPEQRRWLAALGISGVTIERHGLAAQTVAHPLLSPPPPPLSPSSPSSFHSSSSDSSGGVAVDAVAVPYYQGGRLVDARYYVLAPAAGHHQEEQDDEGRGGRVGLSSPSSSADAAAAAGGLVVAASWMARGGRALYVAGEGATEGSEALLRAAGDVVVVGDELDALAVAEAFEQEQQLHEEAQGGSGGEEGAPAVLSPPPPPPPPPSRPTVVAIPQPLPSWRRDVPLYSDPRRRLYHLSQQLQRAREDEQRRRDREGHAPPATGAGRQRAAAAAAAEAAAAAGGGGGGGGTGGMLDYLLPHASSVVFACRASPKGSHAVALHRQRQQWEERQRQQQQQRREGAADHDHAGGEGAASHPAPHNNNNPAPDAALDGAAADEALAAEAARLFGEARCKTVQWPQAWTDHWERWQDGGAGAGGNSPAAAAADEAAACGGDSGLRCGALHMLLADGGRALRLYVQSPREWPIAGLQRFFDYADEIYTAFGDADEDGGAGGAGGLDADGNPRPPRAPLAYSTGWPALDEFYRVAPGEVTLVTGVPNSGKSEWLDALAVNLAERHGWRFALCSMEKRSADHARQLLEKRARRPMLRGAAYATARGGQVPRMTEEELVAAFRWLDHHFVVLEASGGGGAGFDGGDGGGGGGGGGGGFGVIGNGGGGAPTLEWILDRARAAVAKYGVRGLIIDPYNEIDHASARAGGGGGVRGGGGGPRGGGGGPLLEHEHVASVMSSLRRFAQRHGVHVWLVAHPRQLPAWAGQAPTLMDVSGGANFMAKADNGVVVHRDWSRVARELASRPDAANGGGGGAGGPGGSSSGSSGGGRRRAAAGEGGSAGEAGASGAAAAAQEAAAAAAEEEAAARRANFGVRIILAKVRNKTTGQRGEAALEYDPVTGRYAEPSWAAGGGAGGAGGGGGGGGEDDLFPPPWAGDPLSSFLQPAAPPPQVFMPPLQSHQQGREEEAGAPGASYAAVAGAVSGGAAQAPPPPPGPPAQQQKVERIELSGGAYAEVSAAEAAAAAAAYDALLEAQLDDWEQAGGAQPRGAQGPGGRQQGPPYEEGRGEGEDWLVNTRRARGDGEGEAVDFDDWTFY